MKDGWTLAYSTQQMFEAELLKRVLGDHDIEAVILDKMDSSYRAFGDIEIYVRQDQLLKAKMLAKEFDA
ncbi:MAG: DUF2007 domain-containing protein [Bacteroidales bacterium]|nr:DUF2007 domain-containing protein [Bacteroidales bacterium]